MVKMTSFGDPQHQESAKFPLKKDKKRQQQEQKHFVPTWAGLSNLKSNTRSVDDLEGIFGTILFISVLNALSSSSFLILNDESFEK